MSQFAHGISSLDTSSASTLDTPIWMLGRQFVNAQADLDTYKQAFESILWFTYRRDYAKMEPYEYTSDAGWGCMLRSAQMMLGQALKRRLLGRDWRVPLFSADKLPAEYVTLLKWFVDSPEPECIYSIHNMVKLGMRYDKLPGEWYGPTTAAQVLRDLVNLHSRELGGVLSMYVPQEGVVYTDDVMKLCVSHLDGDSDEGGGTGAKADEKEPVAFFDPLLNPPQNTGEKEWRTSLLVLIPLRLGLDQLNESYVPALQKSFAFPQSVGIIGGKKGHSVYFVGSQENQLHLLDPHDVHPTAELNTSFPTATHLNTVHTSRPLVMSVQSIDPSMALGFLCETRADYLDFCERVQRLQEEFAGMCPFSVASRRPDYAMGDENMDMELLSDSMNEEIASGDDEDEYVLI
ncbi:Cysteine protease atg4b [Globisporangium polare]